MGVTPAEEVLQQPPILPESISPESISPESRILPRKKKPTVYYKSGKATAIGICNSRIKLYLYLYLALLVAEAFFIVIFGRELEREWVYLCLLMAIAPVGCGNMVLDIPGQIEADIEGFAVDKDGQPHYQPIAVDEEDRELYSSLNTTRTMVLFLIGLQWVVYFGIHAGKKNTTRETVITTIETFVITPLLGATKGLKEDLDEIVVHKGADIVVLIELFDDVGGPSQ